MKKIILAIVLTVTVSGALSASAEVPAYGSAGQMEISGITYIRTSHYSDYKSVDLSIHGGISYFIIENLHLGIQSLFGFSYYKYTSPLNYSNYSLYPGLSFQFGYLFLLSKYIYLDLSSDLEMYYQYTHSSSGNDEHLYVFSPGVVTAVKFKFGRIIINLSFSHKFVRYASEDSLSTSAGSVSKGWQDLFYELSTGIGISYIL